MDTCTYRVGHGRQPLIEIEAHTAHGAALVYVSDRPNLPGGTEIIVEGTGDDGAPWRWCPRLKWNRSKFGARFAQLLQD